MAYTQEENNQVQPEENNILPEINRGIQVELFLDKIAEALIKSEYVNTQEVEKNQKFIRNGLIQSGQGAGVLALFQKDIKANEQDFNFTISQLDVESGEINLLSELQHIADNVDVNSLQIQVSERYENQTPYLVVKVHDMFDYNNDGNGYDITHIIVADGVFSNTSQFIPIQKSSTIIDTTKAEEFLDTNIFELLPTGDSRQARIVRFFQELNALLPPEIPNFGVPVDRDSNGEWTNAEEYSSNNSISYAQENQGANIDEEEAFIHRLKATANDTNSSRTIQDIYNTILPYLTDILEDDISLQDDRPVYQNQSNGYIKFRNLNQGIIIRNTNKEFIEGLDPNNPTYLQTGFTITMWVRFLDKVSEGTLFNFGNPTRAENPFGFKLETFVVKSDKSRYDIPGDGNFPPTYGEYVNGDFDGSEYSRNRGIFQNSNTARFVRLQVRESGDTTSTLTDIGLRDSHLGAPGNRKYSWDAPDLNNQGPDEDRILNYTFIPEDFNEWYFICASYNPTVIEPLPDTWQGESFLGGYGEEYETYQNNPDFWLNHINPADNSYTNFSGFGNRCKVEIISRTDLLRARGFKVD